jgi:4-amino-4-deoxy-L-arabinose transferase-like glycosyltransferase
VPVQVQLKRLAPWGEAAVLAAACATLYLTGMGDVPLYTRGEPREGLVVREMVRTGSWLVPMRPEGEPTRKPALYYWSAAAALEAMPDRPERALRLPSALFGTAAVLATWATARAAFGAATALPAGLILASAFEWTRAATSARVDMPLAAALALLLAAWTMALVRESRTWLALAAVGALLGTLAKGPIALVLPTLTVLALGIARRDLAPVRRLRPILVLGIAGAGAAAWYVAAFAEQGSAFLSVVARENLLRFADTETAGTGHAHGPIYLALTGLVGLLPWTALLPLACAPLAARPRSLPTALAAAWFATGLVFFTLAASKRSVYLLPLYPAIALLAGAGVANPPVDGRLARLARLGARAYAPAAFVLSALAGAYAGGLDPAVVVRHWLRPDDADGAAALATAARTAALPLGLLALGTAVGGVLCARAVRASDWRRIVIVVATLVVAWTAVFDARIHPTIGRSRSLGAFMTRIDAIVPPDSRLYAIFPPDPGLRFYAPRSVQAWQTARTTEPAYLLLWEDELRRATPPVEPLALSDARQSGRGRLALVLAPPGLRTGSRPR